ncbi:MAG: GNAT family N-acetyltransferase [Roseivirga sp.]|nr:GNAT family N-acetyltransferase [Roseivirga sp.]
MIATTQRLQLDKLTLADAPFVFKLVNEPGWIKFIGDRGIRNLKDAENYIINGPQKSYADFGFGLFKVSLLDGTPIGMCGLLQRDYLDHPDIGFAFLAEFTGKGYALEAANATMTYARDKLGQKTIMATTLPENEKSISLLEKIGLRFVKLTKTSVDGPEVKLFSN